MRQRAEVASRRHATRSTRAVELTAKARLQTVLRSDQRRCSPLDEGSDVSVAAQADDDRLATRDRSSESPKHASGELRRRRNIGLLRSSDQRLRAPLGPLSRGSPTPTGSKIFRTTSSVAHPAQSLAARSTEATDRTCLAVGVLCPSRCYMLLAGGLINPVQTLLTIYLRRASDTGLGYPQATAGVYTLPQSLRNSSAPADRQGTLDELWLQTTLR